MRIAFRTGVSAFIVLMALASPSSAQKTNLLFVESKVKNYLPHMTWPEVEQALKRTDMVIIPVGSTEQHGKHMPLGTDTLAALETCKNLAQRTDVVIAPVVLAGLSEHHMGFPGTISLSPETLEAVIIDTARSLIRHGFRKLIIYNGHGGNTVSIRSAIEKINQSTPATMVLLNDVAEPAAKARPEDPAIDWHAGIGETSLMLYLAPSLVDMRRAEQPVLTFPEIAQKALSAAKGAPNLDPVIDANLFRPIASAKKASSREMSTNGVFTSGNLLAATADRGWEEVEGFLQSAVKFIEAWKAVSH